MVIPNDRPSAKISRKGRVGTEGESDKSAIGEATLTAEADEPPSEIALVHTRRRGVSATRLILMNDDRHSRARVQSQPPFRSCPPPLDLPFDFHLPASISTPLSLNTRLYSSLIQRGKSLFRFAPVRPNHHRVQQTTAAFPNGDDHTS